MNQYANDFTDTVKIYYDDLKRTKPMTRAKERRLLRQCRQGSLKARNEIGESNLKCVFDVARRYTGRGVAISDLISEGNMGLMYAIDKFDESKDVKFISYAVWWIRHSMLDAIRRKKLKSLVEVEPDDTYNNMSVIHSEDEEDEEVKKVDTFFSDSSEEFEREMQATQTKLINNIMSSLSEREEMIINHYYGINGSEKLNLIEIGNKMGITSERARQIKNQGIKKMRSNALLLSDCEHLF